MNNKYKILISNRNLYREAELPVDAKVYKIGTSIDCDFRLHKEMFFEEIKLDFMNNSGTWTVMCSDNIYITIGDTRRLLTTELKHGDIFTVKYQESNNEVFTMEFMVDFDSKKTELERRIDIGNISRISIGEEKDNHIILRSEYISNDKIELIRNDNDLILEIRNTTYGVYHNGSKASNKEVIKNGDFISISDFNFYYKDNSLWMEISDKYSIRNLTYMDFQKENNYPMFVRNTRVKAKIEDEAIKILDPDTLPIKPQLNIVTSLMPTLMMFALVVVLRGIMSTSGGSYVIFSICSMGMGVITSTLNIVNSQKKYKKECGKRIEVYNAYIDKKKNEIVQAREQEMTCLRSKYYSTEESISHLINFDSCLFDRTPEDEDFLEVYLGTGRREAFKKIDYKEQEKLEIGDDLCQLPSKIADEYKYIENAPITISLKNANAVGIIGEKEFLNDMLKCFIVDLVSRQYYGDLNIYLFLDEENNIYEGIRMLPHFQHGNLYRNIVCDNQSKNNIFESLYKEFTLRSEGKGIGGFNVVLIMNEHGIKSHPISRFIEIASELNTVFVFFENKEEHLPLYCSKIINLEEKNQGNLFDSDNRNNNHRFNYIRVDDIDLHKVAQMIAPVYCEEISLEGAMRKNISLFELLGIYLVEDLNLDNRWKNSKIYETMAVPLGVNAKDDLVYLNLHEKFHGPHGLVAGTTGSGKSEILLTYILAAATLFHPYEISFVIIDFKGGGMANQIKNLPHMVGAITNIDGKEINRSLKSIKAELLKRQSLFALAEVNHIDKYIKLYKEGKVETALPHLVIIVDEFAELKAEQPEFMKELISAARIGRSLGVHLILATQKPAGQVNEQIWSNSKFKLCLKVQTGEDSNEVLKSPLAAEIREPGRAYLQVGNNEIFELFQSGFSGAPEKSDDRKIKKFKISSVEFTGKRTVVFEQKAEKYGEQTTQLDAVVNYVSNYCQNNKIQRLQEICLPSLEKEIFFDFGRYAIEKNINMNCAIGLYDDPDNQYQGISAIEIATSNTLIIGSSQYGKTNLLEVIIRNLAEIYTPEEVNIYIIDFGSMVLKIFENLAHVGGVVCPSDDEKLKNLFKYLNDQVAYRREKLLEVGVSSYLSYKEAGYKDMPLLSILIDNLTVLKELYLQDNDVLLNLCREGISVGITFVVANAQTSGMGYRYLSNFSTRIALFCNEHSEYSSLFGPCKIVPDDAPGRGLVEIEKTLFECQTFLAFEGDKEIERVRAMQKFAIQMNEKYKDMQAAVIPEIPEMFSEDYIYSKFGYIKEPIYKFVLGLNYATVLPMILEMGKNNLLAVSGREESGKSNFITYFVHSLLKSGINADITIFDDYKKKLKLLEDKDISYYLTTDNVGSVFKELNLCLQERFEALVNDALETPIWKVIIINNESVVEMLSTDKEALTIFRNAVGKYKMLHTFILIGNVPNMQIPYGAPEVYKIIKENRNILFFDDLENCKIIDIPLSLIRNNKKKIDIGDAYFLTGNDCYKLKTPLAVKINSQ